MRISKTLIYFLIFTVVSSFVAYKLVIASYDNLGYADYTMFTE